MNQERYYELGQLIKDAIAARLHTFHIEDGETEVTIKDEKGKLFVQCEGQKWLVTLQPRQ